MTDNRPDDPIGVMQHAGSYKGKTALVVLGGPSAKGWEKLRDRIKPDVILGVNGVNSMIPDLDFFICMESLVSTAGLAERGDKRAREFMKMLQRTGAKVRLINRKNIDLLLDHKGVIAVQRREPFEADEVPADFSFREYGPGFIKGALMKDREAIGNLKLPVGTVALQLLHMAGILGCAEVDTIGLDLCFKGLHHHAYNYPKYEPNKYFLPPNFITHKGLRTMRFWVESAQYLINIKPQMDKVGMEWVDHSGGLLAALQETDKPDIVVGIR